MVNTDKLKGKMVERRMSVEQIADNIGMDKSTLYRRLSCGGKTFTIEEAAKIGELLQLSGEEMNDIFFAHYVA